jgi:hypothetical protein
MQKTLSFPVFDALLTRHHPSASFFLHLPQPFLFLARRGQIRLVLPSCFGCLSLLTLPLRLLSESTRPFGACKQLHVQELLLTLGSLPL